MISCLLFQQSILIFYTPKKLSNHMIFIGKMEGVGLDTNLGLA